MDGALDFLLFRKMWLETLFVHIHFLLVSGCFFYIFILPFLQLIAFVYARYDVTVQLPVVSLLFLCYLLFVIREYD